MDRVTPNLSATYAAEPASVPRARCAVAEFAAAAGAGEEQVDAVRLATSEAVTNAVLHAYRGAPGAIYVTAAAAGGELWILIADDGEGLRPESERPGLGLGLGLIAQVCDHMAIVPRSGGGTEVRIGFGLSKPGVSGGVPSPAAAATVCSGLDAAS